MLTEFRFHGIEVVSPLRTRDRYNTEGKHAQNNRHTHILQRRPNSHGTECNSNKDETFSVFFLYYLLSSSPHSTLLTRRGKCAAIDNLSVSNRARPAFVGFPAY